MLPIEKYSTIGRTINDCSYVRRIKQDKIISDKFACESDFNYVYSNSYNITTQSKLILILGILDYKTHCN